MKVFMAVKDTKEQLNVVGKLLVIQVLFAYQERIAELTKQAQKLVTRLAVMNEKCRNLWD